MSYPLCLDTVGIFYSHSKLGWSCVFFSFFGGGGCYSNQVWILLKYGCQISDWAIQGRGGEVRENEDTEYFNIVAGVLQGDTLAPYLFIICLDYVLRTSIDKIRENGFKLTKKRSRRYPTKTITNADDIVILANTPNQAETLLHSLEQAAAGIGLHVNAHKTEYMCYNHTGDISTLDRTSLKLVDKFTYQGSSISSTEKDWYTANKGMDSYR